MFEGIDSVVLRELENFRKELSLKGVGERYWFDISQGLDRLMLGYRSGKLSVSEVHLGLDYLRKEFGLGSGESVRELSMESDFRERVLGANESRLLERFLSEEGHVDGHQLEMLQGVLTGYIDRSAGDERERLVKYQGLLSEKLWSGDGSEISVFEDEVYSQMFMERFKASGHTMSQEGVGSLHRHLMSSIQVEMLKGWVREAKLEGAILGEVGEKLSQAEALAVQSRERFVNQYLSKLESDEAASLNAMVRDASERICLQSFREIKAGIGEIGAVLAKSGVESNLLQGVLSALGRDSLYGEGGMQRKLSRLGEDIRRLVSESVSLLSDDSPEKAKILLLGESLERSVSRARMADVGGRIDLSSGSVQLTDYDNDCLVTSRGLYERQQMRFEQSLSRAEFSGDLLKVLDPSYRVSSVERPVRRVVEGGGVHFSPSGKKSVLRNQLFYLEGLSSQISSEKVVYASKSGSELNLNVARSLDLAEKSSPRNVRLPQLHRESVKHLNRLMRSMRGLSYHPSMRGDLGGGDVKYEFGVGGDSPLFKRVSFESVRRGASELLPSVYEVAGLRRRGALRKDAPLRKAEDDSKYDFTGRNLELVKLLEDNFDKRDARVSDKMASLSFVGEQRHERRNNMYERVAEATSEWVTRRRSRGHLYNSADDYDRVKTGRLSGVNLESSLRSEAQPLPSGVRSKLAPYLGFDLSEVKIYAGPIADMAARAMGAQAFTLGKHIFFSSDKLNMNSAEGLGLLAHELLHTSHFNSGDSVNVKEEAAEALEARVKKAFDPATRDLALEKGAKSSKKASRVGSESLETGTGFPVRPGTAGRRHNYDVDLMLDSITEIITDWVTDSFAQEKRRKGMI